MEVEKVFKMNKQDVVGKEQIIGIVTTFAFCKLLIGETYSPMDIIELAGKVSLFALKDGDIQPCDIEGIIDQSLISAEQLIKDKTRAERRF